MRPKKTRIVHCSPEERIFIPKCKASMENSRVHLTLDEFEALRLCDCEGLEQAEAAENMQISRPTFSRILSSARRKVSDGLIHLKEIRIEGGCCQIDYPFPRKKNIKRDKQTQGVKLNDGIADT